MTEKTQKPAPGELINAVAKGDLEKIQALLEQGSDINEMKGAYTPLTRAAIMDDPAVARLLINKGARINAKNSNSDTALSNAASSGSMDVLCLLIEKGAALDEKDNEGRPPLFWAVNGSRLDVIQLLIDKGADLEATDNKGRTAFDMADQDNHPEVTELLQGGIALHQQWAREAEEKRAHDIAAQKQQYLKARAPKIKIKAAPKI